MDNIKPILHTIVHGDTLYDLAIKYNTTVQNIIDTNLAINPYSLRVGQSIYIFPNYGKNNICISNKQINLIRQMDLVWEQHIMWTRMLLISIAESLKDLDATQSRLLENPKDIANVFKEYYGNNVANIIQKLLTEHLVIGKELIIALKNNEQLKAKELNKKWYKNADEIAEAFSSINPFYNIEEIRKMLYEHLYLTTNEVSNRLKGNYLQDIKDYDLVQKEILRMSEFFVNGIVKQFSNKF